MMDPSEAAGHTDYRKLAERMGRKTLERRIRKQASLWAREVHQGKGFFMFEGIIPMDAPRLAFARARWSSTRSASGTSSMCKWCKTM
jgi:hypothetical protein